MRACLVCACYTYIGMHCQSCAPALLLRLCLSGRDAHLHVGGATAARDIDASLMALLLVAPGCNSCHDNNALRISGRIFKLKVRRIITSQCVFIVMLVRTLAWLVDESG